jgi:hypothetical protein
MQFERLINPGPITQSFGLALNRLPQDGLRSPDSSREQQALDTAVRVVQSKEERTRIKQ